MNRVALAKPALALIACVAAASYGCSESTPAPAAGSPQAGDAGEPSAPADADSGAPASSADAAAAPPTATFQTIDTHQFLSANTSGAVDAASNTAGTNETFALVDVNGGALTDGDVVHLVAPNGAYLSAANGGGGALAFGATSAGDNESFVLVRVDAPGAIAAGDHVALKTKVTGNYVSAIDGGGGDVLANAPWDHAWETFVLGLSGSTPPPPGKPPGGNEARAKVLAWLASVSGKSTAIGIENKSSSTPHSDSDHMSSLAGNGEYPSFWSADWGFDANGTGHREDIVQEGKAQWAKGALVQYIYHACPPTKAEPCGDFETDIKGSHLDDTQWADSIDPAGALHKVWLTRLDALAKYFQELKDAGVAPLFRPHHEMNGSWAWWTGRPGDKGSAGLYRITHDYLVNVKGLDNIIWVWNVQDYPTLAQDVKDYTPGSGYFDIAALDVYNTGYTTGNYDAMVGAAGGKPIGVGECQKLPATDLLGQQPLWTYVAMWPDFYADNTATIPSLFANARVLTLSKMPGWK